MTNITILLLQGFLYEELRIVVVGKNCYIKRGTLDALLGSDKLKFGTYASKDRFVSRSHATPGISQLQRDRYVDKTFERVFIVTTTPDITDCPIIPMRDDIVKFLTMTSPGPHMIILAVETGFEAELENYDEMLKPFIEVFGENVKRHFVLSLDRKPDGSVTSIFDNSPICKRLVQKHRLVYLEQQKRYRFVSDILRIVRQIRRDTMVPYFSNHIYETTEKFLKLESLEQYDSQLEKVRDREVEIASLSGKLSLLKRQQNSIKDLNTRELAIKHFDTGLLKQSFQQEIEKSSRCDIL